MRILKPSLANKKPYPKNFMFYARAMIVLRILTFRNKFSFMNGVRRISLHRAGKEAVVCLERWRLSGEMIFSSIMIRFAPFLEYVIYRQQKISEPTKKIDSL